MTDAAAKLPEPRVYPPEAWIGYAEVAVILRCSEAAARTKRARGKFTPDGYDGRKPLFRAGTIYAYLEAGCGEDEISGSVANGARRVRGSLQEARPENGQGARLPAQGERQERSRRKQRTRATDGGRGGHGRAANSSGIREVLAGWKDA